MTCCIYQSQNTGIDRWVPCRCCPVALAQHLPKACCSCAQHANRPTQQVFAQVNYYYSLFAEPFAPQTKNTLLRVRTWCARYNCCTSHFGANDLETVRRFPFGVVALITLDRNGRGKHSKLSPTGQARMYVYLKKNSCHTAAAAVRTEIRKTRACGELRKSQQHNNRGVLLQYVHIHSYTKLKN